MRDLVATSDLLYLVYSTIAMQCSHDSLLEIHDISIQKIWESVRKGLCPDRCSRLPLVNWPSNSHYCLRRAPAKSRDICATAISFLFISKLKVTVWATPQISQAFASAACIKQRKSPHMREIARQQVSTIQGLPDTASLILDSNFGCRCELQVPWSRSTFVVHLINPNFALTSERIF